MEITYTNSEDDFARAGSLMLRKRNRALIAIQWCAGVALAYMAISLASSPAMRATTFAAGGLPRLVGGAALPVLILCLPFITQRAIRKQFRKTPLLSETRTLSFDEFGHRFRSSSAEGQVSWSAYESFLEDRYSFLLVQQGSQIFVPIPKRELNPDQIEQLRTIFSAHLGRK